MIKKLVKHGNSLALVIDKPILDLLKIDKDTPLEISTNGSGIVAMPAGHDRSGEQSEERKAQIREILDDMDRRYGTALENLARGE